MSSFKRPFVIPFIGLKVGKHEFTYEIGDTFFEEYEYSAIESADLQVKVLLDKKETLLIMDFFLIGEIGTACDRCMDSMVLDIDANYRQIFKFGHEESGDETLTVLHPDEYEVDVKDFIYEFVIVSLPSKKVHPEGECDLEMLETMEKYTVNLYDNEEEIDNGDEEDDDDESPWSILKDFK